MKTITTKIKQSIVLGLLLLSSYTISAQTNVFDDVIAPSANHTYLEAALIQENLDDDLQNSSASLTVFAPTDAAFDALAVALGTDINGLLALPNLNDILLYHVLGSEVASSAVTNGLIANPLSTTNTIKMTKTSGGSVYANHALVTVADIVRDNGVVHVIDAVLLPSETVVDVAIDNGFSYLATAVITAELLPALTNPLSSLTVFAPTNTAFDDLASALSTDINGLLALPNLADILTYHVLNAKVLADDINNGDIVDPLSSTNTLKLTKKSNGNVFVNHAQVTTANVNADNGVVHILDAVVLPNETVVDIALDNGFTTLATAVVTAELLPALTNPLVEYTVFAPTNTAFDNLATELGTDINGILALSSLSEILLYHVVSGTVLSTDLTNGNVTTLNGQDITVDLTSGVKINDATVTTANVTAENGVVHIIDEVLIPNLLSIINKSKMMVSVYPNPTQDLLFINLSNANFKITNALGAIVKEGVSNNSIDVSTLPSGVYTISIQNNNDNFTSKFIKQ